MDNSLAPTAPVRRDLAAMADATKADRNRAVDLYRAAAMLAVAIGHWVAIVIGLDAAGEVFGGNVLEFSPNLAWITWILQVMPLFFVVGGFSSAMSLDAHTAVGGRPQDWVAARLRRMLAPAIVLAATWIGLIVVGTAVGQGALIAAGATSAAIPLWFLSNYTIDTAIAPYVLPRFRRHPRRFLAAGLGLFVALEAARFAHVPLLPKLNWVLGWLLFQVAGFAWRDGLLPTGRRLAATAAALWAATVLAVTVGPYPVAMVHFPGVEHSPTHPPTLALLLFGLAYSATALVFAPIVSAWLARSPRAWAATVGANAVAMSVYLWHFTAAVAAAVLLFAVNRLPTADPGTAAWWLQKLPLIGLALILLVGIVARVARYERRALLAPRMPWSGGEASMLCTAVAVSAAVKLWASGSVGEVLGACVFLCLLWTRVLRAPAPDVAKVRPAAPC